MFKNYFKTAWRSLVKGKSFSFINITGLAIGMAGAALILLWLQHEISFDRFHTNKHNLYEVYGLTNSADGHPSVIPVVAQPLGPALKQTYPEVLAQTRAKDISSFLLTAGDKSFTNIKGCLADASFLNMFSFPLAEGSNGEQLENTYSITITQKLAKKLFGNEDAVGKIIKIDSVDHFKVTGVLEDLPANTRFDFEYLLPFDYLKKLGEGYANDSWLSNNTPTYVLLQPGTDPGTFNRKIKNIARVNAGRNDIWTQFLFPLSQWHLYNHFEDGKPAGGRIETVRVFGMIALFILLIACINFMNLSTARSEQRAKEVGIRKVSGAGKSILIGQFVTEAFLTACIAGSLSLLVMQLALPSFNTLIGSQLSIPYASPLFWLCAFAFIAFTGLLAGIYPAFYLSAFNPVSIFKKQFKRTNAAVSPRKVLVMLQFTFAVVLIISTLIIRDQVIYAQDRDKGYSANNLIQVDFSGDIEKNYALIKQELLNAGIASSVTKTMTGIAGDEYHSWGLRWANEIPKDTNTALTLFSSDADLVKTTGLQLVQGRDIDINKYAADSFAVVLNETAVTLMGFKEPVGQVLTNPFRQLQWHVVGVVKDYITSSPYEAIPPIVIMGPGAGFNTMHIKLNASNATAASLAKAGDVFKKYNSSYPFDYQFVDQQYAARFKDEQRTKTMAGAFAFLAIFISCLGLFGLSAYVAESRIKEIGVRKVLGASVLDITKLLSLDFIKLVVIAIAVAIPVAYYAMNKWLQDYSYRINIGWEIFLAAGLLAVVIALATVSFQSVKAAIANPVRSLKTE